MSIKSITSYLAITLCLNLTVSCSTSTTKTAIEVENVDIPTVKFEPFANDHMLSDSFSKVKFIQLETTDDCIISSNILKIEDADGTLIVLTEYSEIFTFEKENGKLLHQIGAMGEGPEEYIEATDIYYNEKNNTITVYDRIKRALISYAVDGKFIRKQTFEAPLTWADHAVGTTDDYWMFSNSLQEEESDYAYTLINPDGKYSNFDPFAPVYTEKYASDFAKRPMTSIGEKISFFKFINDTIFSMENGKVIPTYKLSLKKRMPRKDIVAQYGPYKKEAPLGNNGEYFTGFGEIFETEQYIAIVPTAWGIDGYFWIDKNTGMGYRVPASFVVRINIHPVLQGRSIANLVGSNKKELISSFPCAYKEAFLEEMSEYPELKPFSPELKPFWENIDPDGNPCLIIYEH